MVTLASFVLGINYVNWLCLSSGNHQPYNLFDAQCDWHYFTLYLFDLAMPLVKSTRDINICRFAKRPSLAPAGERRADIMGEVVQQTMLCVHEQWAPSKE